MQPHEALHVALELLEILAVESKVGVACRGVEGYGDVDPLGVLNQEARPAFVEHEAVGGESELHAGRGETLDQRGEPRIEKRFTVGAVVDPPAPEQMGPVPVEA